MRKNSCIQSRVLWVESLSALFLSRAMLELDQILRANEINFAILAALPAFFLSLILAMLVCAWFKKDIRAEGRGRVARIQRRLLLVEIESYCAASALRRSRITNTADQGRSFQTNKLLVFREIKHEH